MKQEERLRPRRLAFRMPDQDGVLVYEIQADDTIYWLRPRRGQSTFQKLRVRDPKLIELIRQAVEDHLKAGADAGQGEPDANVPVDPSE